jgi:hypothetical protein
MESKLENFYTSLTKDQLKALKRNSVVVHLDGEPTHGMDDEQTVNEKMEEEPSDEDDSDLSSESLNEEAAPAEEQKDTEAASKNAEAMEQGQLDDMKAKINLAEAAFVDMQVQPTATKEAATIDTLYQPLESTLIHATFSNSSAGNDQADSDIVDDARFKDELLGIRETSRQHRTMAKLGMDRRNEVDLQLDVASSERISKAVNAAAFKTDLQQMLKENARDPIEFISEQSGQRGKVAEPVVEVHADGADEELLGLEENKDEEISWHGSRVPSENSIGSALQ